MSGALWCRSDALIRTWRDDRRRISSPGCEVTVPYRTNDQPFRVAAHASTDSKKCVLITGTTKRKRPISVRKSKVIIKGLHQELESSQSPHTSAKAMLFARWQHHLRFVSGFPYVPLKAMVMKISK